MRGGHADRAGVADEVVLVQQQRLAADQAGDARPDQQADDEHQVVNDGPSAMATTSATRSVGRASTMSTKRIRSRIDPAAR